MKLHQEEHAQDRESKIEQQLKSNMKSWPLDQRNSGKLFFLEESRSHYMRRVSIEEAMTNMQQKQKTRMTQFMLLHN